MKWDAEIEIYIFNGTVNDIFALVKSVAHVFIAEM